MDNAAISWLLCRSNMDGKRQNARADRLNRYSRCWPVSRLDCVAR